MVEATAEANLQLDASFFGRVDGLVNAFEVVINRFLTEDILACFRRFDDEFCMGIRRGSNDDGLDFRVIKDVSCIFGDVFDAELLDVGCRLVIHERICDRLDFHVWDKQGNVADVNFANASCADDTNFHDENLSFVCVSTVWYMYCSV